MNSDFGGWSAPPTHNQHTNGAEQFSRAVPLGGQMPVVQVEEPKRDTLGLLMAALLLVSSVVLALATTFEWRDYGDRAVGVLETGWTQPNGSLGRGWFIVVIAIVWAIAGVCVAASRKMLGRRLAIYSAALAALYAIAEWGFGVGELRSGPGIGLWFVLVLSALVMMILGGYDPEPEPT